MGSAPQPGSDGRIFSGPWILFADYQGGLSLQNFGVPFFSGGGPQCGHRGHTKYSDLENLKVERQEGGFILDGLLPGTQTRWVETVGLSGDHVTVRVDRQGPWPQDAGWSSYQLPFPISRVEGCTALADGKALAYPPEYREGNNIIQSGIHRLELCPQDPKRNLILESDEPFGLYDRRQFKINRYMAGFGMPQDGDIGQTSFRIFFADLADELIAQLRYSAAGYPTAGPKSLVLEWPLKTARPDDSVVIQDRQGKVLHQGRFGPSKEFLGHQFARFDFSQVRKPGPVRAVWSGGASPWFPISDSVAKGTWEKTLDVWLPWQMCHAQVQSPEPAWSHDPCHMDDGIRVPAHFKGPDGFPSYDVSGTPYKAGDPVACALGGWHDAGDNDLNLTVQAHVTHRLALAYEALGLDRDQGSLDLSRGTYFLGRPDGIPDLVQQVAWGTVWILSMQQKDGRVYVGLVHQPHLYGASKAPEHTTDNKPQTGDERHVYADYHPDHQLKAMVALSAASRTLRSHYPKLASKAGRAVEKAWEYFKNHGENYRPTSYFKPPQGSQGRDHMVLGALAEVYLTTGSAAALKDLRSMVPNIGDIQLGWPSPRRSGGGNFWYAPPFAARLGLALPPGPLRDDCLALARRGADILAGMFQRQPWPLDRWDFYSWGNAGSVLNDVHDAYWLSRIPGSPVSMDMALPSGLWMFGLHPLNNLSLVHGVAGPSPRYLYSSRVHARMGREGGQVPGSVVPGIGGAADSRVMTYSDDYGVYYYNEACIYTAAEHIFAMGALQASGF